MKSMSEAWQDLVGTVEKGVKKGSFGRVRDLRVELAGQNVVIRGKTPNHYTKQLAHHAALDVLKGYRLVNEIVVG